MSHDRELIEQGRRFLAKATSGHWYVAPSGDIYAGEGSGSDPMVVENAGPRDAALIVWARNNLPTLLDLLDSLGTVTPPAAEGGRPGGEAAAGPSAAPRRDMPESEGDDGSTHAPVEWATARRWRDALSWIGRGGCHEFDYSTCKDFALPCEQWCDSCVALSVLLGADPPTASPQPDPLRSEAARPEPPHGDVRGSGRASHVP